MAQTSARILILGSVKKLFTLIRIEKKEVSAIYFYAILSGLIQLSLPLGIQAIINFAQFAAGRKILPTSMWVLIIFVVLGVLLAGIVQINQMKMVERIQQRIFARYALEFTYKIPKMQLVPTEPYHLPELVNRFFDTTNLQKGISKLLLDIPLAVIQIFFGILLLSFYNTLFIGLGILLILILWIVFYFTAQKGLDASIEESDYKYDLAGWIEELARSFKSFKIFGHYNLHLKKADGFLSGYLHARTTHFNVLKIQYWSLVVFKLVITAAMLIVGAFLLMDQKLNIGQFIAAEIVILMVLSAVEKLILSLDKVYDVLTSLEKLGKVIDKPLESTGTMILQPKQSGISLEAQDLCFGFDSTKPILKHVNFKILAGEKISITGEAGAGKSLLMELMTGAIKLSAGTLLVDQIPVGNYDVNSYRKNIGVFYHEQDIFHGTLLENIMLGKEPVDSQELIHLIDIVGLKSYVDQMPLGFDTVLKPTGKGLSSIISKKILLVRAFIQKPTLLLLDEPFEMAGGDHSKQIAEYLMTLQNTTIIVVTGYQEFIDQSNQVIKLQNGKII